MSLLEIQGEKSLESTLKGPITVFNISFIYLYIHYILFLDDVTRPIDPAAWLQHSEAVRGKPDFHDSIAINKVNFLVSFRYPVHYGYPSKVV